MSESYGAFAYAYDQSLGRNFFSAVRAVLDDVLYKYPSRGKTHLDVACGTGLVLEHLREKHDFRSIGLDASIEMLSIARSRVVSGAQASRLQPSGVSPGGVTRDSARRGRLAAAGGTPALLIAADLRALPIRKKFARITCLYDSLNHMLTREDLIAAFQAIRGVMSADSLFLFDMNHPDIYPAVWGMREPYVSSGKDHHLEIATKYRRRERRGYGRVTGWARLPGGERVKIHETHEQFAWKQSEIESALSAARLGVVEVIDFDPFREIQELDTDGVKMFFVCNALPMTP